MKVTDGRSIIEMDEVSAIIPLSHFGDGARIFFRDGNVTVDDSLRIKELELWSPEEEEETTE